MDIRLEDILYFFGVALITGVCVGYFLRADDARADRATIADLIEENAFMRASIRKAMT